MKNKKKQIMMGNINVLSLFFSNTIIILILLIPFFKTDGYKIIPYLSEISNGLLFIESIIFFILSFVSGRGSPLLKTVVIYGIWVYIITPIFFNTIPPSYYYIFQAIGIISLLELGFSYSVKKLLSSMSIVFLIMIFLNFITQTIYSSGIILPEGGRLFLFGIRTGFPLIIIPGILISLLNDSFNKKTQISIITKLIIVIGILSLLLEWVGTGIVQITIFILLYYFLYYKKNNINIKFSFIIMLIINYIISIMGSTNSIIKYIVKLLGKDITISGRTIIWEKCIEKLKKSIIAGYGSNSSINVFGYTKPAHNHWLHLTLESGLIGCLIMILGFYKSCVVLYQQRKYAISKIIMIFIIVILFGCITEIQLYSPFIYMIFEIPFLLEYIENKDETSMPKII